MALLNLTHATSAYLHSNDYFLLKPNQINIGAGKSTRFYLIESVIDKTHHPVMLLCARLDNSFYSGADFGEGNDIFTDNFDQELKKSHANGKDFYGMPEEDDFIIKGRTRSHAVFTFNAGLFHAQFFIF